MITYVRTNMFESNAQVLVNTVNTVGVMGKGLAKEFKRIYPEMFKVYQQYCEDGSFTIGKLQIYRTPNKWILNFPTKENWRNPSRLEYIEAGLKKFVDSYQEQGIKSISFPMLGCGNGGLKWSEVKLIMEKYLKDLPIDVFVHITQNDTYKPEHTNKKAIDKWLRSEPYYLSGVEFITHLKHKFNKTINTISKEDTIFEVSTEKIDNIETFCLKKNNISICINEPMLISIWQTLRDNGILTKKMLSYELATDYEMVMLFLSELDYIGLTQIGENAGEMAVRLLTYNQPINNKQKVFLYSA